MAGKCLIWECHGDQVRPKLPVTMKKKPLFFHSFPPGFIYLQYAVIDVFNKEPAVRLWLHDLLFCAPQQKLCSGSPVKGFYFEALRSDQQVEVCNSETLLLSVIWKSR